MIQHPGRGDIRAAIMAVAARGLDPSYMRVRGELLRARGVGAARRDVRPVLAVWRAEQLAARSGPIEAAATAVAALTTDLERDAVRRRVRELTGGRCRIRFIATARDTGGGRRKAKRLAAARHSPLSGGHE